VNSEFIIRIIKEIAQPLLILVAALFLVPPLLRRLRKSAGQEKSTSADLFVQELDRVVQRANHVLDDPVLLKAGSSHSAKDSRTAVLDAWSAVDGRLKQLAQEYLQVDPEVSPYPLDYVLFELEMKRKAGNTALGFYRELLRLKDVAITAADPENIPEQAALRYALLARNVAKKNDEPGTVARNRRYLLNDLQHIVACTFSLKSDHGLVTYENCSAGCRGHGVSLWCASFKKS